MTRVFGDSDAEIAEVVRLLREGKLVAIPTETVYGLAANAFDRAACERVFAVKGRPLIDPLIVHIADMCAGREIAEINTAAIILAEKFWPGPLTLILPKLPSVPDIVTAGLPSVALRCPRHPVAREILTNGGLCLAAPSANPFGYVSPTSARHVIDGLGERLDYIVDGGDCEIGLESTIVDLRAPERPLVLRPGAITREAIAEALGVEVGTKSGNVEEGPADAPGLLKKHYSPRKPLSLRPPGSLDIGEVTSAPDIAFVMQRRPISGSPPANLFWMSENGDLESVAKALFGLLRKLDASDFASICIEKAPDEDIGVAINDRLRRAAAK